MSACAAGYADHVEADVALAFVDHALGAQERAEVERRIDACAGCRGIVAAAARDTEPPTRRELPVGVRPNPNRSVQLVAGEVVGRYVVERPLGAGGMGVVSLARDPELRRAVVIKLVRPDASDDDLEARLRREAQAMAQLSHPNVVQIFDTGRHGDRVFLAMEFIAGETLDVWLIEKERSPAEVIAMFLQAGAGLEAAHRAGLLHRDFKPTNVLVDRNGVAKVTDFGLARALVAPPEPSGVPRVSGVHAVLTQGPAVLGTPAYMSPEQAAGQAVDTRTDQYAFALALLDALVGQQPSRRAVKPHDAEGALTMVTPRVRAAIVRALRLDPDERWPDLATFLRELAPEKRERKIWPYVALGAIAIAGVTTFLALRRERPVVSCVAEAPKVWAKQRAAMEAKLASEPRMFAAWHAAHVLDVMDRAVGEIASIEVAQCQGSTVDAACLAKRRGALDVSDVRGVVSCAGTVDETADVAKADAHDRDAREAVAKGDVPSATRDFEAAATIGERLGDDSLRGRAVMGLLDLARARGDLDETREQVARLEALLDKHGRAPADVFRVALASARAFIELGDVEQAFSALKRAADSAKTDEAQLHAQAEHAWAMYVLRSEALDVEGRDPYAAAIAADIAFATGAKLDDDLPLDPLRAARARARDDIAGALRDLEAITGDETTKLRVALARAHIYADARRYNEASVELKNIVNGNRHGLTAWEDADAVLLECAARATFELTNYFCTKPKLLTTGHPKSPLGARYALIRARHPTANPFRKLSWLEEAANTLAAAGAKPLLVAELQLEIARNTEASRRTRKMMALAAKPVFESAGRAAEIAELAKILAELDGSGPPIYLPPDAFAPSGDPWAP